MASEDDECDVESIDDREWGMQWNHYAKTHGKLDSIPNATHIRQFLLKMRINLTEKSCQKLMIICQEKKSLPYVHLSTLKAVLQEALDKYVGLPIDQAVGGLIVEFNASESGRKHRNYQSMQSMQAIVAASTQSLASYALSKVKESKSDRQKRREQEKLKRQLKRERLHAKQTGTDTHTKKRHSARHKSPKVDKEEQNKIFQNRLNAASDDDDNMEADGGHSPASSVVINETPNRDNNLVADEFPDTPEAKQPSDKMSRISFNNRLSPGFARIRSTSSDVALQRREKRRSRDMNKYFVNSVMLKDKNAMDDGDDEKGVSLLDLGANGAGAQQVIEVLKRQENMLHRIQIQMNALERQIKKINVDEDGDISTEIRECMLELEYLKTSALNEIRNELNDLKMELFDGFESISISSAYNVSQDLKQSLHFMNNKISTTVRLWGNDWNVKKRMISNQEKLDHVLFKASKILRKYQEQQSNLKKIKYGQNNNIKMNVPQFISEMDSIRASLKSIDHYLNTFVFDRLSRMEDALVRIFQHSSNLDDPDNTNTTNRTIKRFSVDELMNQLDSQRLNFEGQLRAKSEKISTQKEELQYMREMMEKEIEQMDKEKEEFANLKNKYENEHANTKQLQFDLKSMKSQLERLSMFNNKFGSGHNNEQQHAITYNDEDSNAQITLNRTQTMAIHPDIVPKDEVHELNKNVDLDLNFDRFYTNSLSALIGDFIAKSKLDNKEKANAFHKNKEGGHLLFARDEMPKFLANKNNRDAQQQELEDRLGFGYQELYYLYRENTEINIRCHRVQNENEALRKRLASIEPVVIVENVQNVSLKVKNDLDAMYKHRRKIENSLREAEEKQFVAIEESKFIDKYRLEMLQDAKKIEQEIQSQMNYDKFQFQRQRKKMHALMKSEKEGVLKEREIMEEERAEIEQLKTEWKQKLVELEKREEKLDEKIELARENMNEAVFQKGLTEALREYKDDLKEELRETANQEMIREATEDIQTECNEQIAKQREYYNKRYVSATNKINESRQANDNLKLQIEHFKQQIKKLENDILLNTEHNEKIQGMYDRMEIEYSFLKEEYRKLEKEKRIISRKEDEKDDDDDNDDVSTKRKRRKKKKSKQKKDGIPQWLDIESDDDELTKKEKESISEWLKQRHGLSQQSTNSDNTHWLVLPEDKLAGKDKDIEDLNAQLRQLKHELDSKNREIGKYKQTVKELEAAQNGQDSEAKLLETITSKHNDMVNDLYEDLDTVKRWLKIWQDGIKTVTQAETKWMEKHAELLKRSKQLQKEKQDLIYDQRMWYAHKNHILRRFYYFVKQVWWQRFTMHEFQKDRVEHELAWHKKSNINKKPSADPDKKVDHRDCFLWNQYFKIMLESWFETGVYQHALTRWFCQYNTYTKEKDLFYYGENDNNEELYLFKTEVMKQIKPHLESVVERYYKMKWLKRCQKFGRCWITQEKPSVVIDPGYKQQKKITRELLLLLHKKEPSYNKSDIKEVIKSVMKEMESRLNGFNRTHWDMVKTLDGVGVVPLAQQKRTKVPKTPKAKRKSVKGINPLPQPINTANVVEVTEEVATPGGTKRKKKVRIAPKEVGRISQTMQRPLANIEDNKEDVEDNDEESKEERERERMRRMRQSQKTPKAKTGEKTWSHAMENFKSVNKRNKKKLTAEEKEKLRAKRRVQNKRPVKRSSVRNPRTGINLLEQGSNTGIKMIKPDTGT